MGYVAVTASAFLVDFPPHFHDHLAILDAEVRDLAGHLNLPYDLQLLFSINDERPSGFDEVSGRKVRTASAVVNASELSALAPSEQLNYLRFWLLVMLQRSLGEEQVDWSSLLRPTDLAAAANAIRPSPTQGQEESQPQDALPDYELLTTIPLRGGDFGNEEEFRQYTAVKSRIIEAFERTEAGVHDGHSLGDGAFELVGYANEIQPALDVLLEVLRRSHLPPGVTVTVTPTDDEAGTVVQRVAL